MPKPNPTSLTQEQLKAALHYDPETGKFRWLERKKGRQVNKEPGVVQGNGCGGFYRNITIDYSRYQAHNLAWLYMTGRWPEKEIDHRNCDGLDNRWDNLRPASPDMNIANTRLRSNNSSGFKGVHWHKKAGKWQARITIRGRTKHLGLFACPKAAHAAYLRAAKQQWGDFARGK